MRIAVDTDRYADFAKGIPKAVVQHDLQLCARDAHFDHLPQIRHL